MIVLVTYDIASDRRRLAVSRLLEGCGARVQLSLFECELPTRDALSDLTQSLRTVIDDDEDQVRLYVLSEHGTGSQQVPVEIVGARTLEERRDWWII